MLRVGRPKLLVAQVPGRKFNYIRSSSPGLRGRNTTRFLLEHLIQSLVTLPPRVAIIPPALT